MTLSYDYTSVLVFRMLPGNIIENEYGVGNRGEGYVEEAIVS